MLKPLYLCTILGICALTDIREKKIKNRWILAGFIGFVVSMLMGWNRAVIIESVSLMCLFAIILFPLYCLRMLGAGDVKLLCMSALYISIHTLWIFLLATALTAGIGSLVKLIFYGNLGKRMKFFYQYAKGVYLSKTVEEYGIPKEKQEVIGLGVPVFLGGVSWFVLVYII